MIRPQIGIPRFPWHGDETGVAMRLGRCAGSRRANASEINTASLTRGAGIVNVRLRKLPQRTAALKLPIGACDGHWSAASLNVAVPAVETVYGMASCACRLVLPCSRILTSPKLSEYRAIDVEPD